MKTMASSCPTSIPLSMIGGDGVVQLPELNAERQEKNQGERELHGVQRLTQPDPLDELQVLQFL